MACIYGNCNDANCVAGDSTDVNGNPCDDQTCSPCGSIAITGGVAASTVPPNPQVQSQVSSSNVLTQMTSALAQFGSGIAGIVTGRPVVATAQGVTVGGVASNPFASASALGPMITPVILIVVVIAVVMAISKK